MKKGFELALLLNFSPSASAPSLSVSIPPAVVIEISNTNATSHVHISSTQALVVQAEVCNALELRAQ